MMQGNLVWSSGDSVQDVDPKSCQDIIKLTEKMQASPATVSDYDRIEQIRNNSTYGLDDDKLKAVIHYWIDVANRELGLNFDIQGVENIQISKYMEGEKYSWHTDMFPNKNPVRKLTLNMVLNDDFEGGDFQFSWGSPSLPYKKRVITEDRLKIPGKILVFPSLYYHRVQPVTKGVRYSLTAWAYGPPFK